MSENLCDPTCKSYHAGEPGERFCDQKHFDERVLFNKPILNLQLQVLTPRECTRFFKGKPVHNNWRKSRGAGFNRKVNR